MITPFQEIAEINSGLTRYTIGDEVWFVASQAESVRVDIEYADHTVSNKTTSYRLITIPIKGIINSIYVKHYAVVYENGIPSLITTGGTRFDKDNIKGLEKWYDPNCDSLFYEVKVCISPGVVQPPIGFTQNYYTKFEVDSALLASAKTIYDTLPPDPYNFGRYEVFFMNGIVSVPDLVVGSTPEEAEKKVFKEFSLKYRGRLTHMQVKLRNSVIGLL